MATGGAVPESLSVAEARARVLAAALAFTTAHRNAPPGERGERVPLFEARGRALAEDLVAPHALPPFRNSSMDGVAVRSADLAEAHAARPVTLTVTGTIPAGQTPARPLARGESMRIMTGSMLPEGADAVVPVEELSFERDGAAERVRIARAAGAGENVRAAGADVRVDEIVLEAGRELSAHDLALAGALGRTHVRVGARPRVAILSTGDELLALGEPLRPGAIRDTNLPMLASLAAEAGAEVVAAEHAGDDATEVSAALQRLLASADIVLSIGGVSEGDFDPVKQSLAALGGVARWSVAMKPGKPQAFGAPNGRLFFGLPGNPASVACVFEVLVRPALRAMQGFGTLDRPHLLVRAAQSIESRAGRRDYVRAALEWRDGVAWAHPAGAQISGHLAPQSRADGLVVIHESLGALAQGESAEFMVLRWGM